MDEKKILLNVLEIIGYKDNKSEFIEEFFSLIYAETIAQLNAQLDENTKNNLAEEFDKAENDEEAREIILKYFPKEKFDEKLTQITQDQFTDYLETIYPTLDKQTQERLTDYLNSLPKPQE